MNTLSQEQRLEIAEKYKAGNSTCRGLAKEYRTNKTMIKRILNKNKIPIIYDAADHSRKYTLNENFFDVIDSEVKAYFLGLLFSDGTIGKNSINLSLQERDSYILKDFAKALDSNRPFQRIKPKQYPSAQDSIRLVFHSNKIVEKLAVFGCVKAKSLILKFPPLHLIPNNLLHHFVRGYFDGDGSCVFRQQSYVREYKVCVSSLISTEDFCSSLKVILESLKVKCSIHIPKKNVKSTTRVLSINSNKNSFNFLSWIYKDATFFLKRKYEKFLQLSEYLKSRE